MVKSTMVKRTWISADANSAAYYAYIGVRESKMNSVTREFFGFILKWGTNWN